MPAQDPSSQSKFPRCHTSLSFVWFCGFFKRSNFAHLQFFELSSLQTLKFQTSNFQLFGGFKFQILNAFQIFQNIKFSLKTFLKFHSGKLSNFQSLKGVLGTSIPFSNITLALEQLNFRLKKNVLGFIDQKVAGGEQANSRNNNTHFCNN